MKALFCVLVVAVLVPTSAIFGDVYTWGRGSEGQLGLHNKDEQARPMPVSALEGKVAKLVDAGKLSTTVVTADGKIYMWGQGITKDGIMNPKAMTTRPTLVSGLEGVRVLQFVAGDCHYAALSNKGEVYTWGCNEKGALGRGKMCRGCSSLVPQAIPKLLGRNVRQIVAGGHHTAALTDNGEIWLWGSGEDGEIGHGAFRNEQEPIIVKSLKNLRICQICAGEKHMGAVDTEGHLYTWGSNKLGQLGHGANLARIAVPTMVTRFLYPDTAAIVSCGTSYTGVVTTSNKVFMWGAGGDALPTEKTFFSSPSIFPRAVTAGQSHIVVVTKDHKVYTWGANYQGQLGVSNKKFFTLEPQLVEDLLGKHINSVAAGHNHTVALSGKPLPIMCPVFQDWYGPPGAAFKDFVRECHVDAETCPDKSCCSAGQTCVQFSDSRWGCCFGENMKLCQDDKTCCPKDSTFNPQDQTCEKPVPYVEATRLFRAFEEGGLISLPTSPGKTLAEAFSAKLARRQQTPVEDSVQNASSETIPSERTPTVAAGTPINIIGEAATDNPKSAVVRASEAAYKNGGLIDASEAALKVYQETLSNEIKAEQARLKDSGVAAAANSESMRDPPRQITGPVTAQSAIPSAKDQAIANILRSEISNTIVAGTRGGSNEDAKGDTATMTRKQLIQELRTSDASRLAKGSPPIFSDEVIGLLRTEELRTQAAYLRMQGPAVNSKQGAHMNKDGVMESNPSSSRQDEAALAKQGPTLDDLEDDVTPTPTPIPVVGIDPTQTRQWRENVKRSEKLAGFPKGSNLHKLGVLAPEAPPGSAHPGIAGNAPIDLESSHIQQVAMTTNARSGSGPCPRGAGNLDCNRDCAEVDAKVIDAARTANDLAEKAGALAANTLGAGIHTILKEPSEQQIKSAQDLISSTPSASPSPSASPVSVEISNTHAILRQAHAVVYIDNQVVHVPETGFYRDPATNLTYKFEGDKVTLAIPAAKFAAMAGKPGTENQGHCGVSRPTCPDNSCCQEGETCCQQQDGAFGCCPFAEGTCCMDQRHCCPAPYSCDLRNQACAFNGSTIGMARFEKVDQGLCSENHRACKDGSCCETPGSCCRMFDGLQGCAPYLDATCCSDGVHACPAESTCDTRHGVCVDISSGQISDLAPLRHSSVPPGAELVCFAEEISCVGGGCCTGENTCCQDKDGYESCCPYADGECCGGGFCCPNGYTCDSKRHLCQGSEGDAEMKPTQKGRMPFLVAEACMTTEIACAGTHQCCKKGDGCCPVISVANNKTSITQACCPLGEDSVCCEDGTCCPHGSICGDGVCVHPDGTTTPQGETKAARESTNPFTSTCVDVEHLRDKIKEMIDVNAENAIANQNLDLIAQEPTKQCPPFCGGEGSVTPSHDDGKWASGHQNERLLNKPGEKGIAVDSAPSNSDLMERERMKAEIVDEGEELKRSVKRLSKGDVSFFVRGAVSFSCEWTLKFREAHSSKLLKALSSVAGTDPEMVTLGPFDNLGVVVPYTIEVHPDSQEHADSVVKQLNDGLLADSLSPVLAKLDFPADCGHVAITQPAGTVKHEPMNIAEKLELIDKLEAHIKSISQLADGSVPVPSTTKEDVDSLRTLRNELQAIRKVTGTSDFERLEASTDALEKLENLITLLLDYLSPVSSAQAAELRAALFDKTRKQLNGIFDLIKEARAAAKCMRIDPSKPIQPGCESTNMALANMPLGDEQDDSYDPLLQREFGVLSLPTGNQMDQITNPPSSPVVEHSAHDSSEGAYWMPEQCTGSNCGN